MSRKRPLESADDSVHKPIKRRKDYTDEDAKLAELYDQLSSELQEVQLDAATKLVDYYVANQRPEHIRVRLIRGLGSSRKAARLGFFIALVEVLRSHEDGSDLAVVLRKIREHTEPIGGASKTEKREHSIGRITALRAVVHAGLLFRKNVDVESNSHVPEKYHRHHTQVANSTGTVRKSMG